MTFRRLLPILAISFLLAAAAAGQHHPMGAKVDYDPEPGGGDPNAPPACLGVEAKLSVSGNAVVFTPSTVTVDPGQPVCWTWSGAEHNIRADDGSFTSGPPSAGGTFQRTFNTPGTYGFHCQVHGTPTTGMRGTVVVRDTGGGAGAGPGQLQLASTTYSMNEGAGSLMVTVARVGGSDGVATVKYATANGTAKIGKDFARRNGVLRWENGDQEPKTIEVPITNDSAREQSETFTFKLSKATGASLGASVAMVTIHDDDGPAGCPGGLTAPSQLRARGQSPGEIELTWGDEPAAASLVRIERRQPGGAFREVASVAAGTDGFTDIGLPAGATFEYRVRAEGADGFSAYSTVAAGATDGPTTPCEEKRNTACLKDGRFEATVELRGSEGEEDQQAKRVDLPATPGSGVFALAPRDDLQILLNVHDGCAENDHYWLELAAVTDVELTVRVRDTRTGRTWVHLNPAGSLPASIRDVDAFSTCP
jgi:plastocyanin